MVINADGLLYRDIPKIQNDWGNDDFSEQLDMFDKLDAAPCSADMYAWEADFRTKTVVCTDLPGGNTAALSFGEFFSLMDENDAAALKDILFSDGGKRRVSIDEDIRIKKDGGACTYRFKGAVYRLGGSAYAAGVAYDAGKAKGYAGRAGYAEARDYLTGLDGLEALDRLGESGLLLPCAMVMACVDNLREINDTLGYHAGNNLIKNVAGVIKECFCDADFIVRIGGGEFCAVFSGKNELEIGMMIKEANMTIHKMYLNLIKTEVSFGYAISGDENELGSLYKQASGRAQKSRELKSILSEGSVIDSINDIVSQKAGWGKRSKRLQSLAALIGSELGCGEEQINEIKALAKVADIGLIGVADALLKNRSGLSDSDRLEYMKHIETGRALIAGIGELSDMESLYLDIYKRYDEWQDGIALTGRIVAGAVEFDDISLSGRTAKIKSVTSSLEALGGTRLCPKVVDAITRITTKRLVPLSN